MLESYEKVKEHRKFKKYSERCHTHRSYLDSWQGNKEDGTKNTQMSPKLRKTVNIPKRLFENK